MERTSTSERQVCEEESLLETGWLPPQGPQETVAEKVEGVVTSVGDRMTRDTHSPLHLDRCCILGPVAGCGSILTDVQERPSVPQEYSKNVSSVGCGAEDKS